MKAESSPLPMANSWEPLVSLLLPIDSASVLSRPGSVIRLPPSCSSSANHTSQGSTNRKINCRPTEKLTGGRFLWYNEVGDTGIRLLNTDGISGQLILTVVQGQRSSASLSAEPDHNRVCSSHTDTIESNQPHCVCVSISGLWIDTYLLIWKWYLGWRYETLSFKYYGGVSQFTCAASSIMNKRQTEKKQTQYSNVPIQHSVLNVSEPLTLIGYCICMCLFQSAPLFVSRMWKVKNMGMSFSLFFVVLVPSWLAKYCISQTNNSLIAVSLLNTFTDSITHIFKHAASFSPSMSVDWGMKWINTVCRQFSAHSLFFI